MQNKTAHGTSTPKLAFKVLFTMNNIQIKKEFNAPVEQVFDLLSKHSTYS